MKKFFKKGFSLAEILIALGIISIISTMGITIARKGIDRAYNLYVYSSYKGIQEAINIANAEANDSDGGLITSRLGTMEEPSIFISSLLQTLSGKILRLERNLAQFETPNRVTYEIHESFNINSGQNNSSFNPEHRQQYVIKVTIPKRKTRGANGTTADYCLLYETNTEHELLIPIEEGFNRRGISVCRPSDSLENLRLRTDLLPFFVDTGVEGRVLPDENGTPTYNRRNFTSFQGAYCQIFADDISYNGATVINCPEPPAGFERGLGTALLVSPQNL